MSEPVLTPEDDLFWLQQAGTILNRSVDQLDSGARRLADAMAWFWTAYSAAALVIATSTDTLAGEGALTGIALATPAVLIFGAYLSGTYAAMPIWISFDDRVPDEIRAAHQLAIKRRRSRIRVTAILAGLAALAVTAVVCWVAVAGSADETHASASAVGFNGDETAILVGGHLTGVTEVTVRVTASDGTTKERIVPVVDDVYNTNIALRDGTARTYQVEIAWVDHEGRVFTVADELKRKGGR